MTASGEASACRNRSRVLALHGLHRPALRRAPAGTGSRRRLSLDDVVKATSLLAALLYGLLFLAYRNYFDRLGLEPEDLGITNTYVLVRSIGFTGAMACVAGAIWLMRFISLQFQDQWSRRDLLLWAAQLALWLLLARYVYAIAPSTWPSLVGFAVVLGPVAVGVVSAVLAQAGQRSASTALALLMGAALTVLIPCLALTTRAGEMAQAALAGRTITPFVLAGVPLIDVSTTPVKVAWIGPAAQRPPIFQSASSPALDGMLLGRGANTLSVRVVELGTTVTLPSSMVILQSR